MGHGERTESSRVSRAPDGCYYVGTLPLIFLATTNSCVCVVWSGSYFRPFDDEDRDSGTDRGRAAVEGAHLFLIGRPPRNGIRFGPMVAPQVGFIYLGGFNKRGV
jgi:hypothetical protein